MSPLDRAGSIRPLVGGIQIYNPKAMTALGQSTEGTLAVIVLDQETGAPCLLSSYHVLCGRDGVCEAGELVFQPDDDVPEGGVAELLRWSESLDCAIARLLDPQNWRPELLGLGVIGVPVAPEVGMEIVKSGLSTGVTRGRIASVSEATIAIGPHPDAWPDEELSQAADSGSLWVTADGLRPVALHAKGEQPGMPQSASAYLIMPVLRALGARMPSSVDGDGA